eukprot:m.186130 g.186130  ORF g.186130 m.186130 type:complete len:420 (-) comp53552_c0_seq3:14-1273(-)
MSHMHASAKSPLEHLEEYGTCWSSGCLMSLISGCLSWTRQINSSHPPFAVKSSNPFVCRLFPSSTVMHSLFDLSVLPIALSCSRLFLSAIFNQLPASKQVMAFSATYPPDVSQILSDYMRTPVQIRLNEDDVSLQGIQHMWIEVSHHAAPAKAYFEKVRALKELFQSTSFKQCVVFSNYKSRAELLSTNLSTAGWPSAFLSGDQDQQLRNRTLQRLRKFEIRVLVSTDLTARGIDLEHIDFVVNMDIPAEHETYLHRVGRSGRFGSFGTSYTIVSSSEVKRFMDLVNVCHITPTRNEELSRSAQPSNKPSPAQESTVITVATDVPATSTLPTTTLPTAAIPDEMQASQPSDNSLSEIQTSSVPIKQVTPATKRRRRQQDSVPPVKIAESPSLDFDVISESYYADPNSWVWLTELSEGVF